MFEKFKDKVIVKKITKYAQSFKKGFCNPYKKIEQKEFTETEWKFVNFGRVTMRLLVPGTILFVALKFRLLNKLGKTTVTRKNGYSYKVLYDDIFWDTWEIPTKLLKK